MPILRLAAVAALVALDTACTADRGAGPTDRTPAVAATLPAPTLDRLEGLLSAAGHTALRQTDALRFTCPAPEGTDAPALGATVQHFERAHAVYLATDALASLDDAPDDPAIVRLLTQVAVLNHDTVEGKLQLDPEAGDVMLSLELETDDGLGDTTFTAAVDTLCRTAHALRPLLRRAVAEATL